MDQSTYSNKRIAKNTLLLYIRTLFVLGVSLYTSRIILEVLGVEDFGIYNVVGGVVAMFGTLSGTLSASTSRFITIELGKRDYVGLQKVFSISIVNHIIIALTIVFLSETIGMWLLCNKLVIPETRFVAANIAFHCSILTSVFAFIQIPFSSTIIAYERMSIFATISIIDVVLKLTVVLLLKYYGNADNLIFYASALTVTSFITLFSNWIAVKLSFPVCSFNFVKDRAGYIQMLVYSGWNMFGSISVIAQGQGLNILLNIFFGPVVNAARGIAYQIQAAVSQFVSNFMMASNPQIMKLYAQGEHSQMMSLIYNSAKFSFCLLWLFILPLLLRTEYVLELWLKDVPEFTVVFTKIILVTLLIDAWRTPFITGFHATGKIQLSTIICGSILISTLPIAYIFLKIGYLADSVFIVMLVIKIITLFAEWIMLNRIIKFNVIETIKKVIGSCLLVAFLSSILPVLISRFISMDFMGMLCLIIISCCSIIVVTYCIVLNKNEKEGLLAFVKHKIK